MQTHIPAQQAQQNQSRTEHKSQESARPQFEDTRAEATTQMRLQSLMANSVQSTQLKSMQSMMATGASAKNLGQSPSAINPISLQRMEGDEPLHAKADEPVQREQAEAPNAEKPGAESPAGSPPPQKNNNTGLPDNLKSGIENLSGISMDHVKVHYNSDKPAQLQAHAYAQGSEIHVAPGQEKHLPHEAWHVVQQAQGRVKPTVQMRGDVPVNDDAGLEHEADVMGVKALEHSAQSLQRAVYSSDEYQKVTEPVVNLSPARRTDTLVENGAAVQCKMGFEFETGYTFEVWKDEEWQAVGRTKGAPIYEGDGFSIEGDTHDNCEFILDPFESKNDAIAAATAASDLTAELDKKFVDGYVSHDVGGNWKRKNRIADNDDQWLADAQVTQGVKLADIPKYINDHLGRAEQQAHKDRVTNAGMVATIDPEVKGLVELIIQFVVDFQVWDGKDADEGPKNAQAWMARTKYSDMAKALDSKKLSAFKQLFFDKDTWIRTNPVTRATGVQGGTKVIPRRYSTGEDDKTTGSPTTLTQWIAELCDEVDQDSMSPPQGWSGGNYGMGFMGMDDESGDTPLVLLEYRKTDNRDDMGEMSGKALVSPSWPDYVAAQFDKAKWNDSLTNEEED